jgi:hypothetical protein
MVFPRAMGSVRRGAGRGGPGPQNRPYLTPLGPVTHERTVLTNRPRRGCAADRRQALGRCGQTVMAMSTIWWSCFRVAPPAAWTATPW